MRVAIVGKGGVGKTTISGTLARLIARRGHRVLALDLDPNPGLAWTLGVPPDDHAVAHGLAEHAGEGAPPNAWDLRAGVNVEAAVEAHAVTGPDGVHYLSPGKILGADWLEDGSVFGVRELVRGLPADRWHVVCDIDAATAVSCGQHLRFAEHLLLVSTPYSVSALTVERLVDLLDGTRMSMVASMSRGEADRPGMDPIARIPYDESVRRADRRGVPLLDEFPECPAVAAIDVLATRLLADDAAAARAARTYHGRHDSGLPDGPLHQGTT